MRPGISGWALGTHYYLLSPDGRVYRGWQVPKAPDGDISRFDYEAARVDDPENCGTFEVRDGQLILKMGWQYPETITTPVPDAQGNVVFETVKYKRSL